MSETKRTNKTQEDFTERKILENELLSVPKESPAQAEKMRQTAEYGKIAKELLDSYKGYKKEYAEKYKDNPEVIAALKNFTPPIILGLTLARKDEYGYVSGAGRIREIVDTLIKNGKLDKDVAPSAISLMLNEYSLKSVLDDKITDILNKQKEAADEVAHQESVTRLEKNTEELIKHFSAASSVPEDAPEQPSIKATQPTLNKHQQKMAALEEKRVQARETHQAQMKAIENNVKKVDATVALAKTAETAKTAKTTPSPTPVHPSTNNVLETDTKAQAKVHADKGHVPNQQTAIAKPVQTADTRNMLTDSAENALKGAVKACGNLFFTAMKIGAESSFGLTKWGCQKVGNLLAKILLPETKKITLEVPKDTTVVKVETSSSPRPS